MNAEELALLEEINEIRRLAGMPKLDEASRRDFLKKAGAAAAGAAGAAALPRDAEAWWAGDLAGKKYILPENLKEMLTVMDDARIVVRGLMILLNKLDKAGMGQEARIFEKEILELTTIGDLHKISGAL